MKSIRFMVGTFALLTTTSAFAGWLTPGTKAAAKFQYRTDYLPEGGYFAVTPTEKGVDLEIDMNGCSTNTDGRIGGCTRMGGRPISAELKVASDETSAGDITVLELVGQPDFRLAISNDHGYNGSEVRLLAKQKKGGWRAYRLIPRAFVHAN